MDNLLNYYYKKIEELQKANHSLRQENTQLESYLFELLSGVCTEEYKNELRTKLFLQDERIG